MNTEFVAFVPREGGGAACNLSGRGCVYTYVYATVCSSEEGIGEEMEYREVSRVGLPLLANCCSYMYLYVVERARGS